MATIQQILNKIKDLAGRNGLFAIGKGEFFDTLTDMTNKMSEINDNVNSVAKSLVWHDPVVNIVDTLPSSGLTIGQRYILTTDNKIYTATSATEFDAGTAPDSGWAVKNVADGYIHSYNGAGWKNTGLTAFPEEIVLSSVQSLTDGQKKQVRENTGTFAKDDVVGELGESETKVVNQEKVTEELNKKSDHGYESNPKTLKQVDDEVIQLAGDLNKLFSNNNDLYDSSGSAIRLVINDLKCIKGIDNTKEWYVRFLYRNYEQYAYLLTLRSTDETIVITFNLSALSKNEWGYYVWISGGNEVWTKLNEDLFIDGFAKNGSSSTTRLKSVIFDKLKEYTIDAIEANISDNASNIESNRVSIVGLSDRINLFDINAVVDGEYLNNQGIVTVGTMGDDSRSDYINLDGRSIVTFVNRYISSNGGNDQSANFKIGFYDSNKTIISVTYATTSTQTFAVPENAVFLCFTVKFRGYGDGGSTLMVTDGRIPERYYQFSEIYAKTLTFEDKFVVGKKYNAMGDSITIGVYAGSTYTDKSYPTIIGVRNNMTYRNYGISGKHLCFYSIDAVGTVVQRIGAMDNDADIISVFGGTNDVNNSISKGVASDYTDFGDVSSPVFTATNNTICGNVAWLIDKLMSKYPGKKIFFITPYQHSAGTEARQKDIAEAIIETCEYWGVPVLDLYHKSGLNYKNTDYYNSLIGNGTTDPLHPNITTGQLFIANKIEQFMRTIL